MQSRYQRGSSMIVAPVLPDGKSRRPIRLRIKPDVPLLAIPIDASEDPWLAGDREDRRGAVFNPLMPVLPWGD